MSIENELAGSRMGWALLVVDAAKPKSLTPIQLQKALFLFGKQMPNAVTSGFYDFLPYNYGPFSKEIYSDMECLRDKGLVEELAKPDQNFPEYAISTAGAGQAVQLRRELPVSATQYLDKLVKWVESQSFQNLLHAVYKAYPDFAVNSVFNT
jgi:uncharacterized protein YwgA